MFFLTTPLSFHLYPSRLFSFITSNPASLDVGHDSSSLVTLPRTYQLHLIPSTVPRLHPHLRKADDSHD
jgi:hypothetical protein